MPTDLFIRIVLVMGIVWSLFEIVIILMRVADARDDAGFD